MNADKASGILHASLELLALHYAMIDMGRVTALRQESAYRRGIRDLLDFASVFATTAQGGERTSHWPVSGAGAEEIWELCVIFSR